MTTLWTLRLAAALPIGIAAAFQPRIAFGTFLLFAFASAIAPAYDRLCSLPVLRGLGFGRGLIAISLGFAWTLVVALAFYTFVPLVFQGGAEVFTNGTELLKQLPEKFRSGWTDVHEWPLVAYFGIKKEMIDAVADFIREHTEALRGYLSSLAHPGAQAAQWLGHFLFRGTVNVATALALPYLLIVILHWWPDECAMAKSAVRSFLPGENGEALIRFWGHFAALSGKLFKAMATSMLIFSIVFTAILIGLNAFGYGLSIPHAVFDGTILGVTGGIPVFGGLINYFTISVMSLANFGFDWKILAILLSIVLVVHKIEVSIVTPWVVGAHLKFSTLGLMMCFFAGFACWGATLSGIGMSLLLLPWERACKALADEILAQRN